MNIASSSNKFELFIAVGPNERSIINRWSIVNRFKVDDWVEQKADEHC